jgi:predicted NBD/HSP70 family sugar kinase
MQIYVYAKVVKKIFPLKIHALNILKQNVWQRYYNKNNKVKFMRLLDIGGSGVKTTKLENISDINSSKDFVIKHYKNPDWVNFIEWAFSNGLMDSDLIGISCAGFIENNENVKLFRVGDWHNKPLIHEFQTYSPVAKYFLLNDAEAHLMAHIDLFESPIMSISLGTSVGFSISDNLGRIARPFDNINFDIGELSLKTRASNDRVWWALGSNGLNELTNNLGKIEGTKHFGYRIGSFLASICSVFRPKTVVLSGGITENRWIEFETTLTSEFNFQKPDWLTTPNIVKSPFSQNAALVGMAKFVISEIG